MSLQKMGILLFLICKILCTIGCTGLETKPDIPQTSSMPVLWKLYALRRHKKAIEVAQELSAKKISDYDKPIVLMIMADCYRKTDEFGRAQERYEQALIEDPNAEWYDPSFKGYNKIIYPCKLGIILAKERNKCDIPDDPQGYVNLSWKYEKKKPKTTREIIEICFELFRDMKNLATKQQKEFEQKDPPPAYSSDKDLNEELERQFWALNIVGTLYYMKGRSYDNEADPLEDSDDITKKCRLYQKAIDCYAKVVERYSGAYCYGPTLSIYWNVAERADQFSDLIKSVKMKEIKCD